MMHAPGRLRLCTVAQALTQPALGQTSGLFLLLLTGFNLLIVKQNTLNQNRKPILSALVTTLAMTVALVSITGTASAQFGDTGDTVSFSCSEARPRLVVLLHGVTQSPEQNVEIGVGTSENARY